LTEAARDNAEAVRHLTGAIARGDRAALGTFYESWFDRAYTLARSITRRDEAFCLDVVQEAMLRVVRSIKAMDSQDELERWMTRVIHTAALDLLRRESRRSRRERSRSPAHTPSPDPTSLAELAEQIAWLRARLAELPTEDGSLLRARFVQGHSLEQAGLHSGLTGDAAHGRVRRALRRLKDLGKETRDGRL